MSVRSMNSLNINVDLWSKSFCDQLSITKLLDTLRPDELPIGGCP